MYPCFADAIVAKVIIFFENDCGCLLFVLFVEV